MDLWPRVLSPSHNSKKALDLRNHLWPSGNRTVKQVSSHPHAGTIRMNHTAKFPSL